MQNANDVLMGGEKLQWVKFKDPGEAVSGWIVSEPEAYQTREYSEGNPGGGALQFFPSGDPKMGLRIDLQTDLREGDEDDGLRRIYCESREMKRVLAQAVRAAGARGLAVRGSLTLTFTHREDPMDRRSKKHYTASYQPPAQAALMAEAPAAPAAQPPASTPSAYTPPAPDAAPSPGETFTVDRASEQQIRGLIAAGLEPDAIVAAVPGWTADQVRALAA